MADKNNSIRRAKREWLVPASLLVLAAVPIAAGASRLGELAAGDEITAANARFFDAPVPVVLHVVAVSIYAVLGAFQLSPNLRRRNRGRHRAAGFVLIPSGIVAASTGLWMQASYQLPAHDGELLAVFRVIFGTAMLVSLVLGAVAILRRNFAAHGAWMLRAYAIAMGAGTQVLTFVSWYVIAGEPEVLSRALLMLAGWVINLAVAEWIIRKMSSRFNRQPLMSATGIS